MARPRKAPDPDIDAGELGEAFLREYDEADAALRAIVRMLKACKGRRAAILAAPQIGGGAGGGGGGPFALIDQVSAIRAGLEETIRRAKEA